MARKKKQEPAEPTIDDLVSLAGELGLTDDALDNEIYDVCEQSARMMEEEAKNGDMRHRILFLVETGCFDRGRLADILRQIADGTA